jgi:hypothetical protein
MKDMKKQNLTFLFYSLNPLSKNHVNLVNPV